MTCHNLESVLVHRKTLFCRLALYMGFCRLALLAEGWLPGLVRVTHSLVIVLQSSEEEVFQAEEEEIRNF